MLPQQILPSLKALIFDKPFSHQRKRKTLNLSSAKDCFEIDHFGHVFTVISVKNPIFEICMSEHYNRFVDTLIQEMVRYNSHRL